MDVNRLSELRALGYKRTIPRAVVLDVLEASGQHLTAEEIGQAVDDRGFALNRSTIYRTLETLTDAGMVKALRIGRATRYETAPTGSEHHHIVCVACGTTSHLPTGEADAILSRQASALGYRPGAIEILVKATCRPCRRLARQPT
ncbi:MAG: Fur family transcriptional regulator [Candidatus Dormibacteria bacterium]